MNANDYQKEALRTLNPALDKHDVLINGVMGLCGEAGECIDIVKKHLAQGHALDREKLIKELGDVAWYLAETAYALDVELDTVLQGNLDPAMFFAGDAAIESEVRRICGEADRAIERGTARGHIFNLGHGVPPNTDADAITRTVKMVHEL